jgi:tetratricopeptide (TPR) repeat protein
MRNLIYILCILTSISFAQEKDKALQKSNDMIYEGNELISEDFVSAEKEYRKAISKAPSNAVGSYNLGNAMYDSEHYDEAFQKHIDAANRATNKTEKHKSFHNAGNVLMKQELCQEAVEMFKNALRNDPTDDETRYNLALAKECAEQQGGGEGDDEDKNEENKEENKDENEDSDDQKDEGENEEDNENEGDDDQKENEGEDNEDDNGKPQDEKDNKDPNKPNDQQQKKPEPGKLSPQQIKNLLEAMNNQEKKVQEKINAKKTKGAKVRTEKDW